MMAAILATITAGTTRPTAAITTAGTITRLTRAAIAGTGRRPATARAALSKPERNRQRKAGKTAAVPAVARSNLLPALLRQRRCKPAAPRKPLTSQWRPGPPLHSVAPEADAAKSSCTLVVFCRPRVYARGFFLGVDGLTFARNRRQKPIDNCQKLGGLFVARIMAQPRQCNDLCLRQRGLDLLLGI